ncbi:hypothetical protein CEN49_07100 [Fischerella thermalis CCMEE 5273]|uniref:magnesium transporter MgtE N-terminal domain-containing protein n=1 Tax=Fischerella thermalis TaxID=372787 RepID=UPI000C7FB9A2|nr:hypothetical protein [Fischerella thermalis]PMB09237.1 hypothetical protein CEN49_07100 [Fischerella thermalis CCMEE 5273]PMB12666.1 hypothetical protein CEN48_16645 [Fischerella thermalis CCMEE 5282]
MSQNTWTTFMLDITEPLTHYLNIPELAKSLTELELEPRVFAFQLLGEGLMIAVLKYLPLTQQINLLQAMDAFELMGVLDMMEAGDRSQLMASLPDEVISQLMTKLKEKFERNLYLLFNN